MGVFSPSTFIEIVSDTEPEAHCLDRLADFSNPSPQQRLQEFVSPWPLTCVLVF